MWAPRPILTVLSKEKYLSSALKIEIWLHPKITGRCHKITRHENKSQNLPHRNFMLLTPCKVKVKVKWSPYRPGVAQGVGRVIALLFHNRGTRRGWVVISTPRPHFTLGKDPVPIVQEAGWAPGPVWTGGKSRLHRDSIPDRPGRSQSLHRLSYPAHYNLLYFIDCICWLIYCHTGFFTRS